MAIREETECEFGEACVREKRKDDEVDRRAWGLRQRAAPVDVRESSEQKEEPRFVMDFIRPRERTLVVQDAGRPSLPISYHQLSFILLLAALLTLIFFPNCPRSVFTARSTSLRSPVAHRGAFSQVESHWAPYSASSAWSILFAWNDVLRARRQLLRAYHAILLLQFV